MIDNQTQKNTATSQSTGMPDQKKPETALQDNKSTAPNDNKGDGKNATSGSSTGTRL